MKKAVLFAGRLFDACNSDVVIRHSREGGRTALSTLALSAHGHQGGNL